jgi:hypothetical protein
MGVVMAIIETEQELEDYLYETFVEDPCESILSDFVGGGKIFRQVNITGYGIIDLIIVNFDIPNHENAYPDVEITIIELKKDQINYKALEQLAKYRTAIKRYLNTIIEDVSKELSYNINGILIGKKIDDQNNFVYLVDNINWLTVLTYSIGFKEGLILNDGNDGWYSIKEDFDSLKKYLPKVMPDFLGTYKSWHSYTLQQKRNAIVIPSVKKVA